MERFVVAQPCEAFRGRGESARLPGAPKLLRSILEVTRAALPALIALGCSAAPPVELGSDDIVFPESEIDTTEPPSSGTFEPGSQTLGVVEPFMGGGTGRCESSFQPCGGWLPGTSWVVEDTCTMLNPGSRTIQKEGSELLGLDPEACNDVVQSLTSRWSGELIFAEDRMATDIRLRQRRFDIEVGPECFTAIYGVDVSEAELTSFCAMLGEAAGGSIEGASTSCVPSPDGCNCTAETITEINHHGAYRYTEGDVLTSITGRRYEYCVQGNRLLWGEPGTSTHIVMRRRDATYVPPDDVPEVPR